MELNFLDFKKELDVINEKLIKVDTGNRKYGNIIFLAGGGGSGKDFALKKFIDASNFKVIDVDEFKRIFKKIQDLKNKYPEIKDLDLKNPKDVFKLHQFIKDIDVKDKLLDNIFNNLKQDRLPNLVFNVTLKEIEDITDVSDELLSVDYDPKNINLIWVLSNYHVAVEQNKDRERIVPDDILLKTHEGAANTMYSIIFNKKLPSIVDGGIYIILGGKEHTVFWEPSGRTDKKWFKDDENKLANIKDFKYIQIKERGQPIINEGDLGDKLYSWIINNIPKTKKTKHLFPN